MKTILRLSVILSLFLISCTSLQNTSSVKDDLYYSPKDEVKTNDQYAFDNTETKKTNPSFQNKELDKKISNLLEDESIEDLDTTIYLDEKTGNPYQDIVVDNYDEAYQRRLDAKMSGSYGISNNYFILSNDDYWYASAYFNDPFYNVIIVGDQIWVEPRWLSSSFGFYNYGYYPYYGYYGSYYGYYDPFYYNSYYYGSYYSYYRPYYHPYYSFNNYYNDNSNWAGSSFNSFRRRSTATTNPNGNYRPDRGARQLPETYMGNDIRRTRTLKDGIDEQARANQDRRTDRESVKRNDGKENYVNRTTRVVDKESFRENNATRQEVTRKRTSTEGSSNNNNTYTRTKREATSTYDASKRTSTNTRYTRPTKSTGSSSGSGYTRQSSGSSSKSGGSTYTPSRSSGNSGGSVKSSSPSRSSSGSSNNSGSSKSSGSSSGSNRGGRR